MLSKRNIPTQNLLFPSKILRQLLFGLVPDTSPQPGTYRHLKYVSLENEERSVFVDTQYESFSDWSEFSKIHVVLPSELWSEGKKLSNENGLNLSHEDNSIPVIITGVSMVAGVGLAGILLGRIKSLENPVYKNIVSEMNPPIINKARVIPVPATKKPVSVFPSSAKGSKDSESTSTKTEVPNREIVPSAPSGINSNSPLTAKTPISGKTWTEWVQENKGKCTAVGVVLSVTAIAGCHYFAKDGQYFSSTAFWVNYSRLHPVATASKTLTEMQNPALVADYFRLLGFKVPNLPVGRQLEQISTLVNAQAGSWTLGLYNFIANAQRYVPRETPETVTRRLKNDKDFNFVLNYFRSQGVRPLTGTYEQQFKAIQASIEPWPQSYKALAESSYASLGDKRALAAPEISGNQVPIDLSSKQNHEQAIVRYYGADNIDKPLVVYGNVELDLNSKTFKLEKIDGDLYKVSLKPAAKGLVEGSILKPINEKIVKYRARQEFLKNEINNTNTGFKQKNEDLEQLRSELEETNIERDQVVDELKKESGEYYQRLTTQLSELNKDLINLEKEISDIGKLRIAQTVESNILANSIVHLRIQKKIILTKTQ